MRITAITMLTVYEDRESLGRDKGENVESLLIETDNHNAWIVTSPNPLDKDFGNINRQVVKDVDVIDLGHSAWGLQSVDLADAAQEIAEHYLPCDVEEICWTSKEIPPEEFPEYVEELNQIKRAALIDALTKRAEKLQGWRNAHKLLNVQKRLEQARNPKFFDTYCSHCHKGFGPGNEGFAHCKDHAGLPVAEF